MTDWKPLWVIEHDGEPVEWWWRPATADERRPDVAFPRYDP